MRPILIGAGRGSRLGYKTKEIPKTLVNVMGRPMLEWIMEALQEAGFKRSDIIFIAGYQSDVLRARYPEFTYVENENWQHNNVLGSLLCARDYFYNGFLLSYTDIVYRSTAVHALLASDKAKVIAYDTDWRRRYVGRSEHPESDAEKLRAHDDEVLELARAIPSETASGEFIGVATFRSQGAKDLVSAFEEAKTLFQGKIFREGRTFERAYLIDLLQWMIEKGASVSCVPIHGGYMEIDTLEDLTKAKGWWENR